MTDFSAFIPDNYNKFTFAMTIIKVSWFADTFKAFKYKVDGNEE